MRLGEALPVVFFSSAVDFILPVNCRRSTTAVRAASGTAGKMNSPEAEPRPLGAKCSVTLALERDTMGNPFFLLTRSPNGRGLAPIGDRQHQICLVRPFLSRKAIFFWVLWAPYHHPSLIYRPIESHSSLASSSCSKRFQRTG